MATLTGEQLTGGRRLTGGRLTGGRLTGGRLTGEQRFAVVVFDGVSLGIMSFAFGVFDLAVYYGVLPHLDVRVVSGEPAATLNGGGLTCPVPYDLDAIRAADLIIIPDWRDPAEPPPVPLLEVLREAHAAGTRVAGLCTGAFVLAAAGLLDDRPATTHWALAGLLAQMYPKVEVRPGLLYIDDGDVLTAGGGAAGMDLGLHLLRSYCGAAVANRLARYMVVPPHRAGGQEQYIESPLPELDGSDPVGETMNWALGQLDRNLPVELLARRARMSRRNFDRRFREITGAAPLTWLTHHRVLRAQQLLESTGLPVEEVARRCGFSSAALYWFTNTGGSSIRFYYQDAKAPRTPDAEPLTVPLGVAGFAGDFSGVRRFAERDFGNIAQWNMHPEPGGHYAAHLEPDVLAGDIRGFYRDRR